MKKVMLWTLLAIGLAACQDENLEFSTPQEMKTSEGVVYPM